MSCDVGFLPGGPEAPVNSKFHWAYKGPEGPDSWHLHYKYCSGERQSPINIVTSSCQYDQTLEPIILDNFDDISEATGHCVLNLTNNGHAASVRVIDEDMRVRGGGLGQSYKTLEFHFHWGSTDEKGSEHALNGRKYPLEMHVVNFAEKYGTVKQAMTQPDGLAVLGVFFELSDSENPHFGVLDEALRHLHKAGEHTIVSQFRLRSLLPEDLSRYWRYNGSLTTPFCFESVIWTVFAEPQKISKSQLDTLRSLLHEEGHEISHRGEHSSYSPTRLLDNWRPIQPVNGRVVKQSFGDFVGPSTLNKPLMDTKMSPYDVLLPVPSNLDSTAKKVDTGGMNVASMTQAASSPVREKQKVLTSETKEKLQSPVTAFNSLYVQQAGGSQPMEEKFLIYNSGTGVSSINSTFTTPSPESLRHSSSNVATLPNADSTATLFGQIQKSNLASGGLEMNRNQQDFDQTSVDSILKSANLLKNLDGANQRGQFLTSAASSNLSTPGKIQQETGFGKVSEESAANPAKSAAQMHFAFRPYETKGSFNEPQSQIWTSPQPQTRRNLVPVRNSPQPQTQRNRVPVRNSPQPQIKQPSQTSSSSRRQQYSQHVNLEPRFGSIAELSNQIRLHRQQGLTQPHQQNRSASSMLADSNLQPMPPVIRHNQQTRPLSQSQQNRFYVQSRQHQDLQQQRQQILQMSKPPTPQQLRAILERLAASNRANARMSTITSGAASIPYASEKNVNSMGSNAMRDNVLYSLDLSNDKLSNSLNYYNGQIPPASSTASSSRSFWMNPAPNSGYSSYPNSAPLLSQSSWPQQLQHQMNMQQEAYQQQVQRQQHQHLQYDPASIHTSAVKNGNTNVFLRAGPGVVASQTNVWSAQPAVPPAPPDSTAHQVFLHNQHQPVRIRRPAYEQLNNWQQMQYQTPSLQYFL